VRQPLSAITTLPQHPPRFISTASFHKLILFFGVFCRILDFVTRLIDLLPGFFYCLIDFLSGVFRRAFLFLSAG
jgi:hypothetical protein